MRKQYFLAIVLGILLLGSSIRPAGAEILIKLGMVDTQRVLEQCQLGKEVKEQLEKLLVDEQKKVDDRESELQKLKKELDENILLSAAKRKETEDELKEKYKDYQLFARDARSRLDEGQKKALAPIIKEINGIIKKIGVEEGYSVVLDKNYTGILFSSPEVDLTDRVIRLMDEKRQ